MRSAPAIAALMSLAARHFGALNINHERFCLPACCCLLFVVLISMFIIFSLSFNRSHAASSCMAAAARPHFNVVVDSSLPGNVARLSDEYCSDLCYYNTGVLKDVTGIVRSFSAAISASSRSF